MPVSFTLATLPPMPITSTVKRVHNKVELTWPGRGVLDPYGCTNLCVTEFPG